MPLRALLYRRPSEPQTIEIAFDQAIYPVRVRRHRQARRYTLRIHAATREVVLTMPPRGSSGGAGLRAEARRLDRGAAAAGCREAAPFARRHDRCRCAACRIASCTGRARAARSGSRSATTASALLCVAGEAPHRRPPGRAISSSARRKRDLEAASRRAADAARRRDQAHLGARPVEPLGLVLDHRRAVVFLAADPRAAVRARLSRRA